LDFDINSQAFNDETREIRANTRRLLREVNEPVARAPSVPRQLLRAQRATSTQPTKTYSRWINFFVGFLKPLKILFCRFDRDTIPDKYGDKDIENEVYVSKSILRPTRKTRDRIELLANLKYPLTKPRYSGESQLILHKIPNLKNQKPKKL
jgi:hypothetical protein